MRVGKGRLLWELTLQALLNWGQLGANTQTRSGVGRRRDPRGHHRAFQAASQILYVVMCGLVIHHLVLWHKQCRGAAIPRLGAVVSSCQIGQ